MLLNKRFIALFFVLGIVAVAGIACGTDSEAGAAADRPSEASDATATADGGDAIAEAVASAGGVPAGGLDAVCVKLVLGRTVTGFADITDAERTRVFAECSGGGRDRAGAAGGFRGAGFDPECMAVALGSETTDFSQLTPEQRTAVFEACGGRGLADDGGFGGRVPGQGPGGAGFGAIFDSECVQTALGRAVDDFTQLSPEDRQLLFTSCAGELGGSGAGGGGGFGGRQGARGAQGN